MTPDTECGPVRHDDKVATCDVTGPRHHHRRSTSPNSTTPTSSRGSRPGRGPGPTSSALGQPHQACRPNSVCPIGPTGFPSPSKRTDRAWPPSLRTPHRGEELVPVQSPGRLQPQCPGPTAVGVWVAIGSSRVLHLADQLSWSGCRSERRRSCGGWPFGPAGEVDRAVDVTVELEIARLAAVDPFGEQQGLLDVPAAGARLGGREPQVGDDELDAVPDGLVLEQPSALTEAGVRDLREPACATCSCLKRSDPRRRAGRSSTPARW